MSLPSPSAPQRKAHLDALAIALLLACCLFWGFQQVLAKATIAQVPPVLQSALRAVGASVLLMVWCRVKGIPLWLRDGTLWIGLLAGAFFTFEFACIYLALQNTGASRVTLLLYTSPFWVALLLPLFVKSEQLSRWQWTGLLLAFAAVVLALWGHLRHTGQGWLGDVLALLAGASWGLTTVVIRASRLSQISAERLLFYQLASSAVVLPFISLVLGERWPAPVQLSSFAWLSLFLQTAVGAFASYLVWMWMLTRYPAARMSAFVFLTPVFSLMIAAAWLGEPITATLLIALGLVAVGMWLVNKRSA
jgi:drug/metabolite transporter (DMT)-like permease